MVKFDVVGGGSSENGKPFDGLLRCRPDEIIVFYRPRMLPVKERKFRKVRRSSGTFETDCTLIRRLSGDDAHIPDTARKLTYSGVQEVSRMAEAWK